MKRSCKRANPAGTAKSFKWCLRSNVTHKERDMTYIFTVSPNKRVTDKFSRRLNNPMCEFAREFMTEQCCGNKNEAQERRRVHLLGENRHREMSLQHHSIIEFPTSNIVNVIQRQLIQIRNTFTCHSATFNNIHASHFTSVCLFGQ